MRSYAKQLIEDTIRRNASPVRMDETSVGVAGTGSCSSLTSSNSDEMLPRANRQSVLLASGAQVATHSQFGANQMNQYTGMHGSNHKARANAGNGNQVLLHSLSTNDASLGEYKYTVNVGPNSLKITGDCFDLVRVAKLVLDEYFSSSEFMSYIDSIDAAMSGTGFSTPTSAIPPSHQLTSTSPFVDSGIGLNFMGATQFGGQLINQASAETEDDVFVINDKNGKSSNFFQHQF